MILRIVRANARSTDPDTSHQAAERATLKMRESQQHVLSLFRDYGAMTDEEAALAWREWSPRFGWDPISPSGLRTRRCELVRMGLMVRGDKVPNSAGHLVYTWNVVRDES